MWKKATQTYLSGLTAGKFEKKKLCNMQFAIFDRMEKECFNQKTDIRQLLIHSHH